MERTQTTNHSQTNKSCDKPLQRDSPNSLQDERVSCYPSNPATAAFYDVLTPAEFVAGMLAFCHCFILWTGVDEKINLYSGGAMLTWMPLVIMSVLEGTLFIRRFFPTYRESPLALVHLKVMLLAWPACSVVAMLDDFRGVGCFMFFMGGFFLYIPEIKKVVLFSIWASATLFGMLVYWILDGSNTLLDVLVRTNIEKQVWLGFMAFIVVLRTILPDKIEEETHNRR